MNCLIGIAGGSGSGKSTLAYGLRDRFPTLIEVVYFTDYQKPIEQIPFYQGMKNWDCPEAIDFDRLLLDLSLLKRGNDVEIMTKNERYNPTYTTDWKRKLHVMRARRIIIVEGYMALTDERVRRLYNMMIFLDLNVEERMRRRRKKLMSSDYIEKILLPMQEQYVEPTKRFASLVIDTAKHNSEELQKIVLAHFRNNGLL